MTSTVHVQSEIKRFLSSEEPEVLCISGEWGTGKTYTWQTQFDHARKQSSIALSQYAYVSLFGINSLSSLKLAIFENTQLANQTADKITQAKTTGLSWFRKSKNAALVVPHLSELLERAGPLFFSSIENQLICIDDLERRSPGLLIAEALGLISFLKEQRKCKIVLLLNDDELGDSKGEFDDYREKVIDTYMQFSPTAIESAQIALSDDSIISRKLSENCITLRISNIRIIKKIESLARKISPLLTPFHEHVLHQALHSLTLFGWSKFQPNLAPSIKFLIGTRSNSYYELREESELNEQESAWNTTLKEYGFGSIDEFDKAILDGVTKGFFDPDLVKARAEALDATVKAQDLHGTLRNAWDPYYDSFECNEDEVIESIYNASGSNIQILTPQGLSAAVAILKDFENPEKAKELIQKYVTERDEQKNFWALDDLFPGDKIEPDVQAAFAKKLETYKTEFDPTATLIRIHKNSAWNHEDLSALAATTPDEYYRLFKAARGENLHAATKAALTFGRIHEATDEMKEVASRAKQALSRIAGECRINARRIKQRYGIDPS